MTAWILQEYDDRKPRRGGDRLRSEGDIDAVFAPCSTFKVPLALMGFDSGILGGPEAPEWPYTEEAARDVRIMLDHWKKPHTPSSWMKNSCLWYSQELTRRLGRDRFRAYVEGFGYGNRDISGDNAPGTPDNGLVRSWLTGGLRISPLEQVQFFQKMIAGALPVSPAAHAAATRLISDDGDDVRGRVFAKTGSGFTDQAKGLQKGWYAGWVEKEDRRILFACLRAHEGPGFAGPLARKFMRSTVLQNL